MITFVKIKKTKLHNLKTCTICLKRMSILMEM
jgi:hypothetical protein